VTLANRDVKWKCCARDITFDQSVI